MCTLTLISIRAGLRLVMNRDELATRPRALPPVITPLASGGCSVMPIDPASGGTWIAASNSGLMLALMNGNPMPMPPLPPAHRLVSRGRIIPALIGHMSARAAIDDLSAADLSLHAPFRLVAADPEAIIGACWDRSTLRIDQSPAAPVCFVSSGLGDRRVAPRLSLFQRWQTEHGTSAAAQDAFHAHRWPDRPEISVQMCREGARTVSVTIIEPQSDGSLVMSYSDDAGSCSRALPPLMLEPSRAR